MKKKYQIFISSTYEDLKEERKKVQDTILSMYQFPIGMEMFSASDEEQWEIIRETIDSSDYYVLIIGHRYGSVIEEGEYAGISYTQKEFRYALEQKIPVLAFLIDSSVPTTPEKIEQDASRKEKLEQFKAEVKSERMVQWWTSKEDLSSKVSVALNKEINRGKRPGWIRLNGLKLEETHNESSEMSKKIIELELENRELKKRDITREPQFAFRINNDNSIYYKYKPCDLKHIKEEFSPIVKENIIDCPVGAFKIEEYNRSLPTKEELNEYLENYWHYENVKNNSIPFEVEYKNIGNKKANDIHICVSFSEGLQIMTKTNVEKMVKPERPKTLENPIDKYKNNLRGYNQLVQKTGNGGHSIGNQIQLSIQEDKLHREGIKDNKLNIWDISLIHTKEGRSREYYLIPIGKGEYKASISIICEEMEVEVIQEFEISVI